MEETKKLYCGSAKHLGEEKYVVELNLTQLWEHLKDPNVKKRIHTFDSKVSGTNKTIKLYLAPLREVQKYRTHSIKVINWDSKQQPQQRPAPAADDDIPF